MTRENSFFFSSPIQKTMRNFFPILNISESKSCVIFRLTDISWPYFMQVYDTLVSPMQKSVLLKRGRGTIILSQAPEALTMMCLAKKAVLSSSSSSKASYSNTRKWSPYQGSFSKGDSTLQCQLERRDDLPPFYRKNRFKTWRKSKWMEETYEWWP